MPTFRSSSNVAASASSVTLNKPTGTVDGDYLLAAFLISSGASVSAVPSGWTQDYTTAIGGAQRFYVYKKLASGEPASWSWTLSTSTGHVGSCACVTDVDQSNPLNISGGQLNASSVNVVAPSITTTVANTLGVGFFATTVSATFTAPGGMTEFDDLAIGPNSIEGCYQTVAATGATGTRTAVATSAAANSGWFGAIAPPTANASKIMPRFATMG